MPRSSVRKNCSRTSTAKSWCCVKSRFEYLEAYAGIAREETAKAFLTNATGERVARRNVVSMHEGTTGRHRRSEDFSRACESVVSSHPCISDRISARLAAFSLKIPRSALVESVRNPYVYVVENNVAKQRKIEVGRDLGDQIEVLSGLKSGETVITTGQINVSEGAVVQISK